MSAEYQLYKFKKNFQLNEQHPSGIASKYRKFEIIVKGMKDMYW